MSTVSERIQEMMRRFEEQAQKASDLQSAMQNMQGTASSPDRSVTVTVGPSGAVLDLQLAPNAVRQSADALQQQILTAIREATANAAQQMNEAVAPILGGQLDQFQQAFNAQASMIKSPVDDRATGVAGPATSQRRSERSVDDEDEDEDFSEGPFLQ